LLLGHLGYEQLWPRDMQRYHGAGLCSGKVDETLQICVCQDEPLPKDLWDMHTYTRRGEGMQR